MRLITIMAILAPGTALADTLRIDPLGGADYDSIAQALAAAQSGDELLLAPGKYPPLVLENGVQFSFRGDGEPGSVFFASVDVSGADTQISFDNIDFEADPHPLTVDQALVNLSSVRFVDVGDGLDAPINVRNGGRLVGQDVTVADGHGLQGVLRAVSGSIVELDGCYFEANEAEQGGALQIEDATLILRDSDLTLNRAIFDGGAVAADNATVTFNNVRLRGNEAERGGALFFSGENGHIELSDLDMSGNHAELGGHLYHADGAMDLVRSRMTGGMAELGGAVYLESGHMTVRNAGWYAQEDAMEGGAMYMDDGTLEMSFATLYGNPAEIGGGLAMEGGEAHLRGVIIAANQAEAIANAGSGSAAFFEGLVWGNEANDAMLGDVSVGPDSLHANPLFLDAPYGDFILSTNSPALDAVRVGGLSDPDDTMADMGMFGGPTSWELPDSDEDGFVLGRDCDDTDPAINEAMGDLWYDGIDSNCDGMADFDQDGDGFDAAEFGGDDCNDTDPDISPIAKERPGDFADSDCDGLREPDQDNDGWDGTLDCDDTRPDVYPHAEEVWYDGIDQNCDGNSDFDKDHDGFDSAEYGGLDCDDDTPFINPDMPEIPDDGVDNNCDGLDASQIGSETDAQSDSHPYESPEMDTEPGPTSWNTRVGCSTVGAPAPLMVLALAGLGLALRRRED